MGIISAITWKRYSQLGPATPHFITASPERFNNTRTVQNTMCFCLSVQYCCSCTRPGCPHSDAEHPHYHQQGAVWSTEQKTWQPCRNLRVDEPLLEHMEDSTLSVSSLDGGHGIDGPLCTDLKFEGWRMNKVCPTCEHYYAGLRHSEERDGC